MTVPRARAAAARPGFSCRGCGHGVSLRSWQVPERMFQTGGAFTYGECASCGSLSIADVPADLDRHYPGHYQAFAAGRAEPQPTWRSRLLDIDPGATARLLRTLLTDRAARILDVGAGGGRCLHGLWRDGYRHLHGVDPHLPPAAAQETPFALRRGTLRDCPADWDVIMYHHVLEHIADPRAEVRLAAARLARGGRLIVRVPLADSWARRHFGTCWSQWDAPRHLWLPTRAAIRRLADEAGLVPAKVVPDSRAEQFWASLHYRRGLSPANPHGVLSRRRQFLAAAPLLLAGMGWSRWLNARGRGDQAAFILEKPE